MAEWSRPVFAGERPVYIRLPTFGLARIFHEHSTG